MRYIMTEYKNAAADVRRRRNEYEKALARLVIIERNTPDTVSNRYSPDRLGV